MKCTITPLAALLILVGAADVHAGLLRTYVTGEDAADVPTIFEVTFDPTVEDSAVVKIAVQAGFHLDGIDFVPGTLDREVVIGAPPGLIALFDVFPPSGVLPPLIPDTNLVVPAPAAGGTSPSTVLSTPTHVYYVENQFGFGGTSSHRIMRKPFGGAAGSEELVFDGSTGIGAVPLINFEGLEIVEDRLYFFSRDPGDADRRSLNSIGLIGGLWDAIGPAVELAGLAQTPFGTDGSDELDFDAGTGVLFGTNIYNGEVIALDLSGGASGIPTGIFIDGASIAASLGVDPFDGLSLLAGEVDGIRSDGMGHLIFVGRAGVMGAIDIAGVKAGLDDGDVLRLYSSREIVFDDLTPFTEAIPEPGTMILVGLGLAGLWWRRRRRA